MDASDRANDNKPRPKQLYLGLKPLAGGPNKLTLIGPLSETEVIFEGATGDMWMVIACDEDNRIINATIGEEVISEGIAFKKVEDK